MNQHNTFYKAILAALLLLCSLADQAQTKSGLDALLSKNQWDSMFPRRAGTYGTHPQGYTSDFYSYSHLERAAKEMSDYFVVIRTKKGVWGQLITITQKSSRKTYTYSDVDAWWYSNTAPEQITLIDFASFLNESSSANNKRELAAFLAHISKETTGGWQLPVGGGLAGDYALWGLYFVHEVGYTKSNGAGTYSQTHAEFPPNPAVGYYGRGPIQLSWNYNYGQFSKFLYNDKSILLNYPDSLQESGVLAFKSAIWFWMMPQCPKPSCHQVMHDQWQHDSAYTAAKMYTKGFAHTNNIINGGLECRSSSGSAFTQKVGLRSELYKYYLKLMGFSRAQIGAEDSLDYSTLCYVSSGNAMEDYVNCRVNQSYTGSFGRDTQVACGSLVWIDKKTYTTSTSSAWHCIRNGDRNGRDSLVVLHLNIKPIAEKHDTQIACQSFTWIDSVTYRESTDSAVFVLKGAAANACDSIIRLHLRILPSSESVDSHTSCGSFTWIDNKIYTQSTDSARYVLPGAAANGCDSVVRLQLRILPSSEKTDTHTACERVVWIDGKTYTESTDSALFVLPGASVNGCDSIVRLHLRILSPSEGIDTQTACERFTWIDGNTYTSSTDSARYLLKGAAQNGCDSLVRLDLRIVQPSYSTDEQTACGSYIWIDGKTYDSDNDSALYVLPGAAQNGCDSVIRLILRIQQTDNVVEQDGSVLRALNANASYQWGRCANGFIPIEGETGRSFQVIENGRYAVEVKENNCTDTSECYEVNLMSTAMQRLPDFRVYPNPGSRIVYIEHSGQVKEVEVFNALGIRLNTPVVSGNERHILDLSEVPSGTYMLRIHTNNRIIHHKLMMSK